MARSLRAVSPDAARATSDVPVVSTSPPSRRRPSWVLAGVAMVVLAALLGAYLFQAVTDEMSVMVAAHDLEPGEPVAPDDLRVVQMGQAGDLRAIQSNQQDLIIGQAPRAPIPAGTVLNTGLFVPVAEAIPAGRVVVGASFVAGEVPTPSLRSGDAVTLVMVAPSSQAAPAAADAAGPAAVLGTGSVWSATRVTLPSCPCFHFRTATTRGSSVN